MVALLASYVVVFVGGTFTGRQVTIKWFANATQVADAEVMVGHYTTYRDIALDIGAGKIDRAKCNADLGASAMLDGIRDCMAEETCRTKIRLVALSGAPEIVGEAVVPFNYIATKDGRKTCGDTKR